MLIRRSAIALVVLPLVLLLGCVRLTPEEIARRERARKRAVLIGCVLLAVITTVAVSIARRERRKRDLIHAESEYGKVAQQIRDHLPDCSFILQADGKRKRAFRWRSGSTAARNKSLELLQRARYNISLLFRFYPTKAGYVSREELARIHQCCLRCPQENSGSRTPKCLALQQQDVVIDLEFKESE